MSAAAQRAVKDYCSDAVVSETLDGFLGLGLRNRQDGALSSIIAAHAA